MTSTKERRARGPCVRAIGVRLGAIVRRVAFPWCYSFLYGVVPFARKPKGRHRTRTKRKPGYWEGLPNPHQSPPPGLAWARGNRQEQECLNWTPRDQSGTTSETTYRSKGVTGRGPAGYGEPRLTGSEARVTPQPVRVSLPHQQARSEQPRQPHAPAGRQQPRDPAFQHWRRAYGQPYSRCGTWQSTNAAYAHSSGAYGYRNRTESTGWFRTRFAAFFVGLLT